MQCLLGGGGGGGGGANSPGQGSGPLEPRPRPASPQLVACSPPGRYEQPKFFRGPDRYKQSQRRF